MEKTGDVHAEGLRDHVEVRLPARSAYLSVLRTATAGLAARLDFTLDDIEDLRIAVDEACAVLLPTAPADATLTCAFDLERDALTITVSMPSTTGALPERGTFSWTVLTALAGEVDAGVLGDDADRTLWIVLRKRRARTATA